MRFETLSSRVDGTPVTLPFHPRLTVVGPLGGRARAAWIERALGVLLGSRPGDGVGLLFWDHSGQQVRIERDHHGAARITAVGTGDDSTPAAGHLPLDGRFDWFSSVGLDGPSARALIVLAPSDFKGEDVDPWQTEDELCEVRGLLAQVEAEYETVLDRAREVDALYRRVEDLDVQLGRLEEEQTRRRHAEVAQAVGRLEAKATILREAVASERAAAETILVAAAAGGEWRRAADSLEVARLALGDRPAVEPEVPPEAAGVEGPAAGAELLSELEVAHRAVEEAERGLDRARVPALAMAARRRLVHARRREQAVLGRMGFSSWLAFQINRVEDLLGHDAAAVHAAGPEPRPPDADPAAARAARDRDLRLRHTLMEAESVHRVAQDRLLVHLARAGLLPGEDHADDLADHADDLAAQVDALATRAAEAAVHRKTPPTGPMLTELEAYLAEARAKLAAFSRPDWDDHPLVSDTPLPDPEPLLEERAGLFEEAYRIERELPEVTRLEEQHGVLTRRIAALEAASRAGYQLMAIEVAEMVLLDRIAQARQVGARAEPIPLLVDDALAGFGGEDKHDLLHLLARLAEATQVVYLTDDPLTLEWASARAEEGEALVVSPPTVPPPTVASVA